MTDSLLDSVAALSDIFLDIVQPNQLSDEGAPEVDVNASDSDEDADVIWHSTVAEREVVVWIAVVDAWKMKRM